MNLDERPWFQIVSRCWRPALGWGMALSAVAYAVKAVVGLEFDVGTFGALAGAASAPFAVRAVEKRK